MPAPVQLKSDSAVLPILGDTIPWCTGNYLSLCLSENENTGNICDWVMRRLVHWMSCVTQLNIHKVARQGLATNTGQPMARRYHVGCINTMKLMKGTI